MWSNYDFHVWAFNGILMTVWPRLGACFVCLVLKNEMHQPKIVASLVTVQSIHRLRADSYFLSFSVHEERQHNEKLGWLIKKQHFQHTNCFFVAENDGTILILIFFWRLQCSSYRFCVVLLAKGKHGRKHSCAWGSSSLMNTRWYLVIPGTPLLQIQHYALAKRIQWSWRCCSS